MDRRVLVKSLFGIAGAGALALVLPPKAEALMGLPPDNPTPDNSDLPNLDELKEGAEDGGTAKEGFQLAQYRHPHHHHHHGHYRRRYRRWRWRRYCRRSYWHGRYRHRCYRRRVAFWIWI